MSKTITHEDAYYLRHSLYPCAKDSFTGLNNYLKLAEIFYFYLARYFSLPKLILHGEDNKVLVDAFYLAVRVSN